MRAIIISTRKQTNLVITASNKPSKRDHLHVLNDAGERNGEYPHGFDDGISIHQRRVQQPLRLDHWNERLHAVSRCAQHSLRGVARARAGGGGGGGGGAVFDGPRDAHLIVGKEFFVIDGFKNDSGDDQTI